MNISLTGSSGFIGRSVLLRLVNAGHYVNVLSTKKNTIVHPNIRYFNGHFSSSDDVLNNFLKNSDILINCAGELLDITKMHRVNVDGVKRLMELISQNNTSTKFLQLSSAGIYDKTKINNKDCMINENYSFFSKTTYEKTKYEADEFIKDYASSKKIEYIILRPTAIFSRNMHNDSLRRLILYVKKRYFFYIGDRTSIMSYLHLDDLVDVIVNLVNKNNFDNCIYNLSNETKLHQTINAITRYYKAKEIKKTVNKNIYYIMSMLLPSRFNLPISKSIYHSMTSKVKIDSTLAKRKLDFSPKKSLPDYITDLIS